jgi:hypothetical protein
LFKWIQSIYVVKKRNLVTFSFRLWCFATVVHLIYCPVTRMEIIHVVFQFSKTQWWAKLAIWLIGTLFQVTFPALIQMCTKVIGARMLMYNSSNIDCWCQLRIYYSLASNLFCGQVMLDFWMVMGLSGRCYFIAQPYLPNHFSEHLWNGSEKIGLGVFLPPAPKLQQEVKYSLNHHPMYSL